MDALSPNRLDIKSLIQQRSNASHPKRVFTFCSPRERKERRSNEARYLTNADPKIRRGEEMDKRGFSMYKGVPGQPQVPQRTSSLVHELREYQRDSHTRDSHHNRPASASAVHGHHGGHSKDRDHRRH
jgi:hypothetical protein